MNYEWNYETPSADAAALATALAARAGIHPALGKLLLDRGITDEAEVLSTVEKAILFYKEIGCFNERFADTIDRVGFRYAQETILGDKILWRKSGILEIVDEERTGDEC